MTRLSSACPPDLWQSDTDNCILLDSDCRGYGKAIKDIAAKAAALGDPDLIQEESYLLWIMGRLMMLDKVTRPADQQWQMHPYGRDVKVFRQCVGRVEFCHLLFAPGGKIPLHDHHQSNGVMRVLEGSVTSSNFDVVEPSLEGVVLRPSLQAHLLPGRMVSFCRDRNSAHTVVAGESGAYILDVFTLLGDEAGCRYLELGNSNDSAGLIEADFL